MYKIVMRHLRITGRRATLFMTGENATQIRTRDVLTLDGDNTPDWFVLDIKHVPMSLGALKILKKSLEILATCETHVEEYQAVEEWNYIVVCQELADTEKELFR